MPLFFENFADFRDLGAPSPPCGAATLHAKRPGSVYSYLLQIANFGSSKSLGCVMFPAGHFTHSNKRTRFFLLIFDGCFLKTKGCWPEVYKIFWDALRYLLVVRVLRVFWS